LFVVEVKECREIRVRLDFNQVVMFDDFVRELECIVEFQSVIV
jgi:hypothetical protein